MIPPVGRADGQNRGDPEAPKKRIGHIENEPLEIVSDQAWTVDFDLADRLHLLIEVDLFGNRENPENDKDDPSDQTKNNMIGGVGDDLGSAEIGAKHNDQIAGKDTEGQEDPGLDPMLDTCLQQSNKCRSD